MVTLVVFHVLNLNMQMMFFFILSTIVKSENDA